MWKQQRVIDRVNSLVIILAYDVFAHKDGQQADQQSTIFVIGDAPTIVTLTNQIRKRVQGNFVVVIQKHLRKRNIAQRFVSSISLVNIHSQIQSPVVQKVDNAIHWINLYPLDRATGFPNTYPLDSDLSDG